MIQSTAKSTDTFSRNLQDRPPVEGEITKRLEERTARIPSGAYLALAVGSMVASAALAISGNRRDFANFVGLWAPSFLLIGIYNKLVKLEGSDTVTSIQRRNF